MNDIVQFFTAVTVVFSTVTVLILLLTHLEATLPQRRLPPRPPTSEPPIPPKLQHVQTLQAYIDVPEGPCLHAFVYSSASFR